MIQVRGVHSQLEMSLLYIESLAEEFEVGPNVRRFGALFLVKQGGREALWPTQFLAIEEHTDSGSILWPIGELKVP